MEWTDQAGQNARDQIEATGAPGEQETCGPTPAQAAAEADASPVQIQTDVDGAAAGAVHDSNEETINESGVCFDPGDLETLNQSVAPADETINPAFEFTTNNPETATIYVFEQSQNLSSDRIGLTPQQFINVEMAHGAVHALLGRKGEPRAGEVSDSLTNYYMNQNYTPAGQ
jgi:hypothetical protein